MVYNRIPGIKTNRPEYLLRISYGPCDYAERGPTVNDFEMLNMVVASVKRQIRTDCGVPDSWLEEVMKEDEWHDLTEIMEVLPGNPRKEKRRKEASP